MNNDANLSTTLTNSIATKMPLAGGLFTGNVGIGASSLTGGNVGLDVHKTGSGVGSQIRLKNQHNTGFYIGQAGDTTGEVIIWNDANTDMQFRTNGDERLRIKSDGNVGIGTTSPKAIAHIKQGESLGDGGFIAYRDFVVTNTSDLGLDLIDDSTAFPSSWLGSIQ